MKLDAVLSENAFVGEHVGEVSVQPEIYEGEGKPEIALHVIEPGTPNPLASIYLPPFDAVVLAERLDALARNAVEEAN